MSYYTTEKKKILDLSEYNMSKEDRLRAEDLINTQSRNVKQRQKQFRELKVILKKYGIKLPWEHPMSRKAQAGDFIQITERKVSDKVQPSLKVGCLYHVNRTDQLKDGTEVLVLDRDRTKHTVIRCNAARFSWKRLTQEEAQELFAKAEEKKYSSKLKKCLSEEEKVKIAFVPLIISHLAWTYAALTFEYSAQYRISELKKLSRTMKQFREDYLRDIGKYLDAKHIRQVEDQTNKFRALYGQHFIILFHTICNSINSQLLNTDYVDLKAYAFMTILFCRACREYEEKIIEVVRVKVPTAKASHLPYLDELNILMNSIFSDQPIREDNNIKNGMKIFRKDLNEIEFNVVES